MAVAPVGTAWSSQDTGHCGTCSGTGSRGHTGVACFHLCGIHMCKCNYMGGGGCFGISGTQ